MWTIKLTSEGWQIQYNGKRFCEYRTRKQAEKNLRDLLRMPRVR